MCAVLLGSVIRQRRIAHVDLNPPHSMHLDFCLKCLQISDPPHSMHWDFCMISKYFCIECGGSGICKHGIQKSKCIESTKYSTVICVCERERKKESLLYNYKQIEKESLYFFIITILVLALSARFLLERSRGLRRALTRLFLKSSQCLNSWINLRSF